MFTRHRRLAVAAVLIAVVVLAPLLAEAIWRHFGGSQIFGLPASNQFMDEFASSTWVTGRGTLYVDVPSEYPLFANLLFALTRVVSEAWHPQADSLASYEITGLTFGIWAWLGMLFLLWRNAPRRAVWLWLNPATIYFSLYCFDVFLVITSFMALVAARDGRVRTAALWLGLTVALKGFALFAVPAFAVWVWRNRGRREAAIASVLALAPIGLSLGFVLVTSGLTAMMYPFRFQAIRGPDGETGSWDVLIPFGYGTRLAQRFPQLPFVLEIASAGLACIRRPLTFQQLLQAYLIAVGGFLTFSVFYSPQFVLWLVAPVALSESLAIVVTTVALAWATPLFFPISYFHPHANRFFRGSVLLVTVLRTAVVALAFVPAQRLGRWAGGTGEDRLSPLPEMRRPPRPSPGS